MKKRVPFRTVLSGGLWLWYDHMGSMALVNLLWFLFCIPVVTIPAATAGLFSYCYALLAGRDAGVGTFFAGMKNLWRPATLLGCGNLFVLLICAVNVFFYLFKASEWSSLLGMVGAGLFFWVGVVVASLNMYLWPVLCHFRGGLKRIVRVSFLLGMAHPFLLLWLFLTGLCLAVVGAVSGIGLLLFTSSLSCAFATVAAVAGLVLYEGTEEEDLITRRFKGLEQDWKKRGLGYIVKPWD